MLGRQPDPTRTDTLFPDGTFFRFRTADGLGLGDRVPKLAFENPLHARVDRQGERLSARRGIGQPVVEGTRDPGDAMPLRIGKAEDVGREGDLRIEPFLLSREYETELADGIEGKRVG